MYQVEIYGRVRRAVLVEGRSQRSVAREFGLARVTVRKMVGYSMPPGYRRKEPPKRPKLGPWVGVIDAILEEDKQRPAKQRHTAKRIFDRLQAEHSFPGGYTIVKDYVRAATLRGREMRGKTTQSRPKRDNNIAFLPLFVTRRPIVLASANQLVADQLGSDWVHSREVQRVCNWRYVLLSTATTA
jgi:ribosomal protein S14